MSPRAVFFDCANTLLSVSFQLPAFGKGVAATLGHTVSDMDSMQYAQLYLSRLPEFLKLNLTRDHVLCGQFYLDLYNSWVTELGLVTAPRKEYDAAARWVMLGSESPMFSLYPDTLSTLDSLRDRGYRLAVISNWDYTLHEFLDAFDLSNRVDCVLASLEEGVEKPDPRLFQIALDKLGLTPSEVVHVGDDPVDDVEGALSAGITPVLLDRSQPAKLPHRIQSLDQLLEVLPSIV